MVYYDPMAYTVKQISKIAGVSVRTLHYYDEIGLLRPTSKASNGYRLYERGALIRLQQILFYRELDFSLKKIHRIMENPDFDLISALEDHKKALEDRIDRLESIIITVDDTIEHLKGKKTMTDKDLFKPFSEEEQEKYALEAEQLYDPEIVRASNRLWKTYSKEKKTQILAEGSNVYIDMVAAMPKGAASFEVQLCVERWRKHIDHFWTPSLEQLVGLAEGYNIHPGFKKNFDKIDPKLAEFMLEAVKIYVDKAKNKIDLST
jgi:DNA-binding transcriptional MerR regulator